MTYIFSRDKELLKHDFYLSLLECDVLPLSSESKYTSHKLYNINLSFDIETYKGFMYVAQFGFYVEGYHSEPQAVIFRKWGEFTEFIYEILAPVSVKGGKSVYVRKNNKQYKISKGEFVIGIHNMGYEFQWMRTIFEWSKVFSSDKRKPYYAILGNINGKMSGIKFIDTLKLYPNKLEKVAEIVNAPVSKLDGKKYNYKKPRNSLTPLNDYEIEYCIIDVHIVCYALNYLFKNFVIPFKKFPVSQTSQIRFKILQSAKDNKYNRLLNYISECVTSLEFYKYLRGCAVDFDNKKFRLGFFEGGYTHANLTHCRVTLDNVFHFDYTSSYPYMMLLMYYPYKIEECFLGENIDNYTYDTEIDYILELELTDVKPRQNYGVMSSSKCIHINSVLDNGKIFKADKVITIRTRREWETYSKFYKCNVKVSRAWICELRPLPKFVTDNIIEQYKIKSELKIVIKEYEKKKQPIPPEIKAKYETAKQFVNGIYGMFVTEIHTENYNITDGHNLTLEQIPTEKIEKSMLKNPLLSQWGMFVTMYARTRLLEDIKKLGETFIYSDTDSAFFTENPEFMKYIEEQNKQIINANNERFNEPLLNDIGTYTIEEHCKQFKTCGAKCYIQVFDDNTFEPTISGISKKVFINYCLENNFDPLELVEECVITEDLTQKLRPEFYDYPRFENVVDEYGNTELMYEQTSQELIETGWSNSINGVYEKLIDTIQTNMKSEII